MGRNGRSNYDGISSGKECRINGDPVIFILTLIHFLSLYNVIYPSMKIGVSVENFKRLDAPD